MANNLVSLIMQALTPDVIARIASALNLDAAKIQRAVAGAVPVILAGLGSVATQPGGAQRVADAVGQQSASLGDIASMLTSPNQGSFAQSGSQMLTSLLGGENTGALTNVISNFAGIDQSASRSLLGMLTPAALGGLAEQSEGDLSATNIASMLSSQKANIAAALPSGLGDLLAGTGLLGGIAGAARGAASAAGQAASRPAATVSSMSSTAQSAAVAPAPSSSRWILWLVALLIIAALLYYFLARPMQTAQVPQETTPAATQTETTTGGGTTTQTETAPAVGADVAKQVTDTLGGLQATLTGVTDAASAQTALPKLQAADAEIGKLTTAVGAMTAEQKAAISATVKPLVATLNGLIDKVLAIPGVSEVLKPTADALKTKLTALAA